MQKNILYAAHDQKICFYSTSLILYKNVYFVMIWQGLAPKLNKIIFSRFFGLNIAGVFYKVINFIIVFNKYQYFNLLIS